MRHPLVQISPLSANAEARLEVSTFLTYCGAWQVANPNIIRDVYLVPQVCMTPAPIARNSAVKLAQQRHVDILVMVDSDMDPCREFFETAVKFIAAHDAPCVVGSPYCSGPPNEDVMVFEFLSAESGSKTPRWKLERIRREDAARRKGIARVNNIGTGLIAYDMRVFDRLEVPYFDYRYNKDHTATIETEDCFLHRRLAMAGVPIYCDWDHWSGHWKPKNVYKPHVIDQQDIDNLFLREAEENLKAVNLMPHDIPGDETTNDLARLYGAAVQAAPDGAKFVEVGSWMGRSTILMVQLIKRSGKKIDFYAVDNFKGSPYEEYHRYVTAAQGGSIRSQFDKNLERYAAKDFVKVLEMQSVEAAEKFEDNSLDLVYIDADHTESAVTADIAAWKPKVKPGMMLAGHDFGWPGVRAAVEKSLPMSEVVIFGASWMWTKK